MDLGLSIIVSLTISAVGYGQAYVDQSKLVPFYSPAGVQTNYRMYRTISEANYFWFGSCIESLIIGEHIGIASAPEFDRLPVKK